MARRSRKPPAAGAVPADLPALLAPELATLVESPPRRGEWLYEVKFDDFRFLSRIEGADVRLITKNGHDWTAKLPALAAELQSLDLGPAWLDGEVVAMDQHGIPHFDLVQHAFDRRATDILVYFVFDLPYADGWDLRRVPLAERRQLLANRMGDGSTRVKLSDTLEGPVDDLFAAACAAGLEGLIGKRATSPYISGKTGDWIKLKCFKRATFIVGGVVLSTTSKLPTLAALKLGTMDGRKLRYVGKVGTGFGVADGRKMLAELLPERREDSPFDIYQSERAWGRGAEGETVWVNPVYQIEVSYGAITEGGHIRHSSLRGGRLERRKR